MEGLVRPTERPLTLSLCVDAGVCTPEGLLAPSPSLMRVSTDFSTFPLRPLSTVALRLSSGKPMSLRAESLASKLSADALPMLCPKTLDALFTLGGEELLKWRPGDRGGLTGSDLFVGNVDDEARKPKPNRFPGFGGNGGGRSSMELVLPVFCRVVGRDSPNDLCSYFWRRNRSIAPSTSSTSIGMFGLTFPGLYNRFDATLPVRFMFSTWSLLQLSILNDFTLDM